MSAHVCIEPIDLIVWRHTCSCTVNILVAILTTIPWLIFFITLSSELPDDDDDDSDVTHIMCRANLNLLGDSVVTYDEHFV